MTDYKYAAQMNAERLAEEQGLDYFSLPLEAQCDLYERGMQQYVEAQMDAADRLRKER